MDKKTLKLILKIVLGALAVLLAAIIIYIAYVLLAYSRIEDNQTLKKQGNAMTGGVYFDEEYTIVTQNIGFGAYTKDFTFFMDGGKQSRAESEKSVKACIEEAANKVQALDPDFILFQEVDLDSTRSYHIDQYSLLNKKFQLYSRIMAVNYDSPYLMYPLFSPHGASKSSMVTYSRANIVSSVRRSLPVSTSLGKLLDLDRCYTVTRIYTEGNQDLVIYNVHTSAYGADDSIRTAQLTMLFADMKAEYEKGNYVICGGDFNHDFTTDSTKRLNGGESVEYGWAQPFPDELIPEGFSKCINYKDGSLNPTCRNCDVPYEEGNFTIIVDGFIVSNNVECVEVENIVTGFTYSDHNPVKLVFKLKK